MKALFPSALSLIAAAVLSVSCLPDNEYLYSDTGMCTRIGHDKLLSDKGLTYYVVENDAGASIPDTVSRVMISCDVMSEVEGKTGEYNIRLIDYMAAFTAEPLTSGTPEAEAAGQDGINVSQAWISGGYLNGYIYLAIPNPPENDHAINLLYDQERSSADTLYMRVCHDAQGECPENESYGLSDFQLAGTYVSFPLEGILATSGPSPVVHLEWDWYISDGSLITREKSTRSGNLKIE